jgi:hypothetical protein
MKRNLIVACAVVVLFVGCGGENGSDSSPSNGQPVGGQSRATDDRKEVEDVWRRYYGAIAKRDGAAACDLLSDAGRDQVLDEGRPQYGDSCEEIVEAFASLFTNYEPRLEDIKIQGERATARAPRQGAFSAQDVEFERVGGAWKIGRTTDDESAEGASQPTQEQVRRWPKRWCDVQVGMTRDQVRQIMGEPTEEYTAENTPSGFDPQMVWDAFEYHFTAFFNVDDRVRQLDVNEIDLNSEQKAAIDCEFTRRAG